MIDLFWLLLEAFQRAAFLLQAVMEFGEAAIAAYRWIAEHLPR